MTDAGAKLIADAIGALVEAVNGIAFVYFFLAAMRWLSGGSKE